MQCQNYILKQKYINKEMPFYYYKSKDWKLLFTKIFRHLLVVMARISQAEKEKRLFVSKVQQYSSCEGRN